MEMWNTSPAGVGGGESVDVMMYNDFGPFGVRDDTVIRTSYAHLSSHGTLCHLFGES